MRFPATLTAAWTVAVVLAQRGVISPLASSCLPGNTHVVCINKYASVMPYPFVRPVFRGTENPGDSFQGTDVPNDPSFALTKNASFIVFDRKRGLKILGDKPSYRFAFKLPPSSTRRPSTSLARTNCFSPNSATIASHNSSSI